jgi:hypothetical protein
MCGYPSNGEAVEARMIRCPRSLIAVGPSAGLFLLTIVVASWCSSVAAQEFKTDPVDDKAMRNSSAALLAARRGTYSAADRVKIEEYFVKGFFPDMTRNDPTSLGRLGDKRDRQLFRTYLWGASNPQLQSDVTKWAFDACRRMASPGYHPAVRYNAILILGMLDQEYAIDQGPNRRPPKPYPEANKFLVTVVTAGADGNRVVSPVVLAGALIGLERHARFRDGLPREAPAAMTAAALKIVTQDKPPLDMDRDVYSWIRLKAASVLAELRSVGTNNQVHDALVNLVANGRTLDDRCSAAALLDKLNYDGVKVDGAATSEKMLGLARDVAEAEAKRAEEYRDMRFAGGGMAIGMSMERGGYGMRGSRGGPSFVGEPQDDYPRREVLARFTSLETGITKIKPLAPADDQKKLDDIVGALGPAIDALGNKDTVSLSVASDVLDAARSIMAVTGGGAAVAAPTEGTGFDEPIPAEPPPAAGAPTEGAPADAQPTETPPVPAAEAAAPGAAQ